MGGKTLTRGGSTRRGQATSKRDWDALKRDVRLIYTAVNATAAKDALDELTEKWGDKYGAIIRLWNNAWQEYIGVPGL